MDSRILKKNTLSFSCSKSMKYLRTPTDIWDELKKEFNFTLDACASDENHLLDKYYTKDNSALDKDWTDEIGYVHPLFDVKIPKFVEKANNSKGIFVFLLPVVTHIISFLKFFSPKISSNTILI